MASLDEPVRDSHTDELLNTTDIVNSEGAFDCSITVGCGTPATKTCVICKKPMCSHHTSSGDEEACMMCMDYTALEVKKEPLVDDEGVTHEGSKITPIGLTYRTLTSRISQMTDLQLEAHIDFVKKQVREAEAVLDYRRIDLAASQVELEERGVAKRKNLRMRSVASIASSTSAPTNIDEKKKKQVDNVAKQLKTIAAMFGLPCSTAADLAKLAQIVQGMNNKATQAKQPQPAPPSESGSQGGK